MTPEVSLLIRAVVLSLVILGIERLGKFRQPKRVAQRSPVLRLPAEINPVRRTARTEPVQVSPVQLAVQAEAQRGHLIVRLEPQPPTPHLEKRAA